MRKKKLSQINGKSEDFRPTSLDQVWGDTGMSRYSTLDEEKYEKSLSEMNLTDLQTHAVKIGIMPVDRRSDLMKNLIKEFRIFAGSFRVPKQTTSTSKISSRASKILSEGR